jgi:secreted trypsin-like serine protease
LAACGGTIEMDSENESESVRYSTQGSLAQIVSVNMLDLSDKRNISISICTGTLIAGDVVLTTADCVLDNEQMLYPDGIILSNYFHAYRTVKKTIIHDSYSNSDKSSYGVPLGYDVALLFLHQPFPSEALGSAPYVTFSDELGSNQLFWFNSATCDGESSLSGCSAIVTLTSFEANSKLFPFYYYNISDLLWNITTSNPQTEDGDNGGPVFLETSGEENDGKGGVVSKPVLYAIMTDSVGYVARLDPIKDWILQNMCQANEFDASSCQGE